MDTYEALRIAQERGLDLIEIAPTVRPPVCKIMDFGKFKYQREKGEREHGKKQKETEIKSLRIGFTTGKHDLELRAKQAEKFLAEGDKVKIDMILRGREKSLRDFAQKKFGQFLEMIPEKELEQALKRTPQGFIAIIKPQIKTRISHE
ncbi:MAG: Translation initiation factor IF-3 [Parcubacteria group bacterium GW2011_GWA2_42_14]|nr:MAG: Translation initiation factor IF-3 [Parcubacteria group bacterium GW2011_GWA2_42_14]